MTETLDKTGTTIEKLEAALKDSQREERSLAREVDSLPEKIRAATQAHARRLADASRKGKDALARADKESEVPALRERESGLSYERWLAGVRTAALEAEYNGALQSESEDKVETLQPDILPAKEEADAAAARFERIRSALVQAQRGVDVYSGYKAAAQQRLTSLEAAYPGA
jgi:chaperonin cofactor prefoldin